jgi:hypothetical protein
VSPGALPSSTSAPATPLSEPPWRSSGAGLNESPVPKKSGGTGKDTKRLLHRWVTSPD